MTLQTRLIEYQLEGRAYDGFMAWEDSVTTPVPAVAIAHTWGGRSEFEQQKARDLAQQGYVGFALDVYGKGVRGDTPEASSALMQPLMADRAQLQRRLLKGLEVLAEQPEVAADNLAAMGFCFGGLCVLDVARSGADVAGVASFHGMFTPADNTAGNRISAKVLCLHGYDDPMAPPDSVLALASELTAAGADWQLHAYGNTAHAFTNPKANAPEAGMMYSADAERRSWRALLNFLEELFE